MRSYINSNNNTLAFDYIGVLPGNTGAQNKTALQNAIDDLAAQTSGPKELIISRPIPMAGGLTLRSGVFIRGNSLMKGDPQTARFIVEDTTNNLFKVQPRSGVSGLIYHYQNDLQTNDPASLTPYPATFVLDEPGEGVYPEQIKITDSCFIGGSKFIEFTHAGGHQDLQINNIYGYPLHGSLIKLYKCLDIPYIDLIHVNPGAGRGVGNNVVLTGTPCSPAVIDYVISQAEPTVDIDTTDEFVFQRIFAFGVKTALRINNSYGSVLQLNADLVETMADISINDNRKAVQLIGCSGIPSAGPTPANRNGVKFGGTGGSLLVQGLNLQLGGQAIVPSTSNINANAGILVNGSGPQRVHLSGVVSNSNGTFTHDLQAVNGSALIKNYGLDMVNTTNKYTAT